MPRKSRTARSSPNPLRVSDAFRAYVLDQLEELGEVTPRAMFGAVGLYRRGTFFGIVAGDVLYLKVDDTTRGDYTGRGCGPFQPYGDRGGTMRYYAVPVDVLESAEDLAEWARRAVQVAERTATSPRRGSSRRTSTLR